MIGSLMRVKYRGELHFYGRPDLGTRQRMGETGVGIVIARLTNHTVSLLTCRGTVITTTTKDLQVLRSVGKEKIRITVYSPPKPDTMDHT